MPLLREQIDSNLFYFRYKTLDITPSETTFQVIFDSVPGLNTDPFDGTIHPQSITLSIQDVFNTYIDK